MPPLSEGARNIIDKIGTDFSETHGNNACTATAAHTTLAYKHALRQAAQRVKDIERVTNHDVKAVEYALKELVSSYNHHAL